MSRPIRFCKVCGEYVADRWAIDRLSKLKHIDGDGKEIHRGHAPVEGESDRPSPRPLHLPPAPPARRTPKP